MPRDGSGVYTLPPGLTAVPNATIESADWNNFTADMQIDANAQRPIIAGGTGAGNVAGAQINLQIVPSTGGTFTGDLTISKATPTINLENTAGAILQVKRSGVVNWTWFFDDGTAHSGSNAGSDFFLRAHDDAGAALHDVLLVKRATGNVGIGTPNPQTKLHVAGGGARIEGQLQLRSAIARTEHFNAAGTMLWHVGTNNDEHYSITRNSGSGNVLIPSGGMFLGATSAAHFGKFEETYDGALAVGLVMNDTNTSASTYDEVLFYRGPTNVGSIRTTNSSTSYNTSSDERGKPNRERVSRDIARSIINALEVYDYDKDGNDIRGIGLLAQQAHAVHPSLGSPGTKPTDTWMYEKAAPMPFVLVNIQELNEFMSAVIERVTIIEERLGRT